MYYLKIGNDLYQATFNGFRKDPDWDGRESKVINLKMSYDMATSILHDDVKWHIYRSWTEEVQKFDPETGEPMYDEDGNPITETITREEDFDNSEYSLMGDVIVHNDNTTSVKMGKLTDLEQAYELLYGGN